MAHTRRPRALALTEALVARVHRPVPDPGVRDYEGMTILTDADIEAAAHGLLSANAGRPFWVFGYGSLLWKPAFEHVEARRVVAPGWRRSFCLEIDNWRATPEQPGLMLALVSGGACAGMAYRMPPDDATGRMVRLLDREVSHDADLRRVRWLTVRAEGQSFRALAFFAGPTGDPYFLHLPIEAQAARLARAVGHVGSGAEYLRNTVLHLEEIGIRDDYLWRLQELVAAEITALPADGDSPPSNTALP
jgi:glutathione-specific gamma-glutamylcyclotransferase